MAAWICGRNHHDLLDAGDHEGAVKWLADISVDGIARLEEEPAGRRDGAKMTGIVAIDANLFLRHTVCGFLCAMQDTRGGQVPVNARRRWRSRAPSAS